MHGRRSPLPLASFAGIKVLLGKGEDSLADAAIHQGPSVLQSLIFDYPCQPRIAVFRQLFIKLEARTLCSPVENLPQLLRRVVGEVEGVSDTTVQARVGLHERVHVVRVASEHHHRRFPWGVVHRTHQLLDGLLAKIIFSAALAESVGFVDEKHTRLGLLDHHLRLGAGLTNVLCHQLVALHLYELIFLYDADAMQQLSH
mmetsp:Transcript_94083/g.201915  ORF Transcript_94083/g.201915 Transcript_94083/m.201915 type:complete len:200 (+) Transcript_94083:561-1160(+)